MTDGVGRTNRHTMSACDTTVGTYFNLFFCIECEQCRRANPYTFLASDTGVLIDMYLNQISLTGGIPFSVSLPKAPVSIHADAMTTEEIHQKLEKGYNDIAAGRVQNAAEAFAKFRENH